MIESIAILFAFLAFSISLYTYRKQVRLQKRQDQIEEDLRRINEDVARYDLLAESESKKIERADLGITYNSSTQRIVIRNNGDGEAREVDLQLHLEETENPIPNRELVEKLPAPLLFPGDYIELMCPRFFGIPNPIRTTITWKDPDNLRRKIDRPVYLS